VCRRGGGEVDADEDVDDGPAEGTQTSNCSAAIERSAWALVVPSWPRISAARLAAMPIIWVSASCVSEPELGSTFRSPACTSWQRKPSSNRSMLRSLGATEAKDDTPLCARSSIGRGAATCRGDGAAPAVNRLLHTALARPTMGRLSARHRELLEWRDPPGGSREPASEGGDEVAEFVWTLDDERPVEGRE
jgi:hypothetical protein